MGSAEIGDCGVDNVSEEKSSLSVPITNPIFICSCGIPNRLTAIECGDAILFKCIHCKTIWTVARAKEIDPTIRM